MGDTSQEEPAAAHQAAEQLDRCVRMPVDHVVTRWLGHGELTHCRRGGHCAPVVALATMQMSTRQQQFQPILQCRFLVMCYLMCADCHWMSAWRW